VLCIGGPAVLAWGTNWLAAGLAVATIASYLWVYTPLKQKTLWCTHVGAVPGALPPLIGWAAAEGHLGALGWILFAILFAWQIPHFMAIAWTYRDDYATARMPMLPVVDKKGDRVVRHSTLFTWLLVIFSLLPVFMSYCTWAYGSCALLAGVYFAVRAHAFSYEDRRQRAARQLFFASIFYLPFVLAALVLDRWLLA
ncbi:MAG TPA: protoheme IX farnesyltransferase, partial [Opitutae bacterium]|nr:protoheme IX farnesyltransferase [Opitutae bacterium]